MIRQKKKYERPLRLWDKSRIEKERKLLKTFGLRRKREIWGAESLLRKYRRLARKLVGKKNKEMEKTLIGKLIRLGVLKNGATLDDVLELTVENILDRRLQTILFRKGLSNTVKHARQLIVHGHVRIGNKKVVYPSYLVSKEEEEKIQVVK